MLLSGETLLSSAQPSAFLRSFRKRSMSMSHHEDNSVPRLMPLLLLSVTFLGVMGVSVILPVLPKITEVFRLSPSEAGLLIACFTLPSAFLTPVAGVLADRFGRRGRHAAGTVSVRRGRHGVRSVFIPDTVAAVSSRTGTGSGPAGHSVRHSGRAMPTPRKDDRT